MRRSITGFGSWTALAMQSTMLAIECQQVIALRLAKIALQEPGTKREAERMISEKIDAALASGPLLLTAAVTGQADMGAGKIIRHYRTAVRANRRRLSK